MHGPPPHRVVSVPILMYHRVAVLLPGEPPITRDLTVTPAAFAAEMRWLHRDGFHAITPAQLYGALERGSRLPANPVLITFDDGYRDVLWNASPVLERLHMRAADFVITGRIDGDDPSFLTWPELQLLEQRGFTIGSHTVHHLELTLLPPREALTELEASRASLEQHLGHAVRWFAYPAGRFDARVVALVRKAGYLLAFTTRAGDVQRWNAPLLLRRDEVLGSTGVAGLKALLGR